jgi:HKD family nuclease
MMNRVFVSNRQGRRHAFKNQVLSALRTARAVDIAVSYLQMSGWYLLARRLSKVPGKSVRILTTDQMNITHPAVLKAALRSGFRVRCYCGNHVYHPKVYVAHGIRRAGNTIVLGSANISGSGLVTGVEAGLSLSDSRIFRQVSRWFDDLWKAPEAKEVTAAFVGSYTRRWKPAAQERARTRRRMRIGENRPIQTTPDDIETLDDVLSTITLPVGTLGFDHAGNNIRNLPRVAEVLSRYPRLSSKERSELHLLGFMQNGQLTALGRRARQARSASRIAANWVSWISATSDAKLNQINVRLAAFRRAATRFWQLRPEVRRFFLDSRQDRHERGVIQAIELCANGSEIVEALSVEDFRTLATLMASRTGLTEYIQDVIADYESNKGSRSWGTDDRRTMLNAWRRRRLT